MIDVEEFSDFFEAIHGPGIRPFSWQLDLLRRVAETGQWPEQVVAPTGAGKSAVVEVHVFASALAACDRASRVPRRLVVVVNRRALTDAHAERAQRIRRMLVETPDDGGILARVRRALQSLRVLEEPEAEPLVVTVMRGAAAIDRAWLNAPEACAVLCMTPAMWASSLLFRSYGAPRHARPRLAGLLGIDSAMVLDEAHLSRQVLVTARRCAQLSASSADRLGLPGLQVVEMTATPSGGELTRAGVTRAGLDGDPRLAERVRASKTARYAATDSWPANGRMSASYRKDVVAQVIGAVEKAQGIVAQGPRTVGCVLNRVDSAVQVAKDLRAAGLSCRLWVGRMRPWDLERLKEQEPGLFTPEGQEGVDVLVATQTVEVGIDLDLVALVTELAPASALAQRAGRVNRRGLRSQGLVTVIGPPVDLPLAKDQPPYASADLEAGREWVLGREVAGDLSPLAVSEEPPPAETPRRLLWQRPEPWDLALWAKTSMDLVIEPELDLWIRDDLEPERAMVGLVLRNLAALPDVVAREALIAAVPPQDVEVFPVTMGVARGLLKRLADSKEEVLESSVLWRDGAAVARWQAVASEGAPEAAGELRSGDLLVLDASAAVLTEGVVTEDGRDAGEPVPGERLGATVLTGAQVMAEVADLGPEEFASRYPDSIVEWPPGWVPEEAPAWLVLRRTAVLDDDSEERSAWSSTSRVTLEAHNGAVAGRAGDLASAVGLGHELAAQVMEAGHWHDAGKADSRFQRMLRRDRPGEELLAKSGGRVLRNLRRAWADAGLPPGWRHELASAAAYWDAAVSDGVDPEHRDLVTRLVGTSHGRGRPLFDHGPQTAGPEHLDALEELVGEGEWEALIARTDRFWGPWGTSYLEALLRAADCSISSEGK